MMNTKKILIFLEGIPSAIGGIERHCYNLIELLRDSEFDVSVLTKNDIKHRYIKRINKILLDKNDLYEKINDINPDIVHIHGFASLAVPQVINCSFKLKKKVVYTAHFHPFHTLNNPRFGSLFFKFYLKRSLGKVNTVITINKEDTEFFRKFSSHVVMIPHWLNNESVIPFQIRDPRMLLFVGRFEINKGIDHILSLPIGKYDIHCVSKGNIIRSDFIQHSNISDDELYSLYAKAGAVIIPSRYEAFSYTALEALEAGCPIVVSDRVRILDYLDTLKHKGVEVFKYGEFTTFEKAIDLAVNEFVIPSLVKSVFNKDEIRKKLLKIYN